MTRNKPPDAEYEDIYDFDYLLEKKTPPRLGQTFTVDDAGVIVRPLNRPRVTDSNTIILPAIARTMFQSANTASRAFGEKKPAIVRRPTIDNDIDLLRDSQGKSGPRVLPKAWDKFDRKTRSQFQRQPSPYKRPSRYQLEHQAPRTTQCSLQNQKQITKPEVDFDREYEKLMKTGDFDPSKNPRVQEYEKRHGIPNRYGILGIKDPVTPGTSDIFTQKVKQYEEATTLRSSTEDKNAHGFTFKALQTTTLPDNAAFMPAPPTVPRPDGKPPPHISRRRLRQPTIDLMQDLPAPSPPDRPPGKYHDLFHMAPTGPSLTPTPVNSSPDLDQDLREAERLRNDLDALQRELACKKTVYDDIEVRPITAAADNSNLPGPVTPCLIPRAAVPAKTLEPVRQWDGHAAKRGVGFRSKLKKESSGKKGSEKEKMPENIRRQMKRYFN